MAKDRLLKQTGVCTIGEAVEKNCDTLLCVTNCMSICSLSGPKHWFWIATNGARSMAIQTNTSGVLAPSENQSELMSAKQGADYTGVTISTWWEWARTLPDFPKPLRISTRCTRWRRSEIDEFLESRRSS